MNFFYLDEDPWTSIEYHCDKHIVKMPTEYKQMLCTAHRVLDGEMYIDNTYGDDDGNTITKITARGYEQQWVPTDISEHSGDIQEAVHYNMGVGMCKAFSFSGVV